MAGRLEGKVAVVTGGASGIGEATCRLFVREGVRGLVQDRRRLAGGQTTEMALQPGEQAAVIVIQGNITAKAEARFQSLFQEAMALNRPRIVLHFLESAAINGAGIAILTKLLLESQKQGRHVVVAELRKPAKSFRDRGPFENRAGGGLSGEGTRMI